MALTASAAVFLVSTCVYVGIRGHFKRMAAGSRAVTDRSTAADTALVVLVVLGQIVLPLLAIFSPYLDPARYDVPAPLSPWAGGGLMAFGVWLFWRAHADLGRNWSVSVALQHEHTLVCSGIYQRIRHPMYASFFVMAVGQVLLVHNWVAGPGALLAVAALYVFRTPREEAMLEAQFGDAYRSYVRSTGALLPKR